MPVAVLLGPVEPGRAASGTAVNGTADTTQFAVDGCSLEVGPNRNCCSCDAAILVVHCCGVLWGGHVAAGPQPCRQHWTEVGQPRLQQVLDLQRPHGAGGRSAEERVEPSGPLQQVVRQGAFSVRAGAAEPAEYRLQRERGSGSNGCAGAGKDGLWSPGGGAGSAPCRLGPTASSDWGGLGLASRIGNKGGGRRARTMVSTHSNCSSTRLSA
jgi:hypothetical protein